MKKIWAFLFVIGRLGRGRTGFHDDSLRANQGQNRGQTFSFWRALVS
jgi:hypothetical protein